MWYWIFRTFFIIIFKLFFRLKVEGLQNLPARSNFIIVANHSSFLDPLVVFVAVARKIHCIAMRDLYRIAWLRWFMRVTGALASGSCSSQAIGLLTEHKNVGLFPEGGVSREGKLRDFRKGAALLALKTGRPVVPCAILGHLNHFRAALNSPGSLFLLS